MHAKIIVKKALLESCKLRFGPILMTTLATALGALPLSIDSCAGAEAKKSIGICIVGGISIGTMFTLMIKNS